ncbi:MAG: fimbrillin family protein [Bacteroidales bacterium]|nr:fimbrillin family protein [Bacteroidales bacterium]
MKKIFILGTCLLALAACGKKGTTPEPTPEKEVKQLVRIAPVMTKVTESAFETGDAIGIFMYRGDENIYAENLKMVFDGSVFSGSLMWYAEGTDPASIIAYYPYSSNGPTDFAVQADQSAGTSASDFVAGAKTGVLPSAHAVTLPFKHKLTRIVLNVTNNAEGEPTSIALKGAKLGAKIAKDLTATVDESSAEGTIVAHKISATQYDLILPPQTVSLIATVTTAGGNELSQALKEAELKSGMQYSISMIVNPADLKVAFSGEISAWEDGGEIGGDNTLIEKLSQGYILYHEDKYTVAKMKDGKWWMTENMRYVPEGITVSDDKNNVTAGMFYPLVLNEAGTAAEFSKDITVINRNGYLYQAETALGLKVGDLTTVDAAKALDGAQGICPKGWHIPTINDITGLVGKAVSPIETNSDAPYYNGSNGSVLMLNEDYFNLEAYGMVSIGNNTATTGTLAGRMAGYTHLCSGFLHGSSYANVSYKVANDETSPITNLQFYGFSVMTNKASGADYTVNGAKVSYRIAGAVRCVRND